MFKSLSDAGHGGEDRYNVGYSGEYVEADGNLKISTVFSKEMSRYKDVQSDLTREQDKTMGLTTRGNMAYGYDLFSSDHTNASDDPRINGVEGFYSVDLPEDKVLVEKLCKAISDHFGIVNRGAKIRVGTNDPTEDYYTVIDKAQDSGCKHVILMEYMFHSNMNAEQILLSDSNLEIIGKIKAEVVAEHFGLELKSDVSPWAKIPQEWVIENGVSDGTRPKDNVTREEMWTMLYDYDRR